MTSDFLVLTFNDIWEQVYLLNEKITHSKYIPDLIVGITRGGLIIARILSDLMENNNLVTIGVGFYKGINETKNEPFLLQDLNYNIKGKKILLVDDVADTGKSLKFAVEYLKEKEPLAIRVATLHYKPHSIFNPDYFVNETSAWIIYPWEYTEFTRLYSNKLLSAEKSEDEIREYLETLKIPEKVIRYVLNNKK